MRASAPVSGGRTRNLPAVVSYADGRSERTFARVVRTSASRSTAPIARRYASTSSPHPATEERRRSDPGGHDQTELQRAKPDVIHAAALFRDQVIADIQKRHDGIFLHFRVDFVTTELRILEKVGERTDSIGPHLQSFEDTAQVLEWLFGRHPSKAVERSALSMSRSSLSPRRVDRPRRGGPRSSSRLCERAHLRFSDRQDRVDSSDGQGSARLRVARVRRVRQQAATEIVPDELARL